MIEAANLPDDVEVLKAMVVASEGRNLRKQDRINHLETLVAAFKQALFGAKSEKTDPDQFELALEDIEMAMAVIHAEDEADQLASHPTKPRKANRGSLPKHLPRIEEVIEPEEITCDCGAKRHVIGEDVSERLDVVPAQFRVIVPRRPKYACRSCEDGIVQALAPARLIPGGLPTEATVAHVIVSKYADHLPLYRQAQIYSRQGIDLDRSTLASWVGKAAFELKPVFNALIANPKRSNKLFMPSRQIATQSPAG
jgi:transposase